MDPPPPPPPPPSPPPPPPEYGSYGTYPAVTAPGKNNGLAIASLVVSILGCSVIGIVLGFVALSQLKKNPQDRGKGLAIGGIVIGFAWIVISAAFAVVVLAGDAQRDDTGAISESGSVRSTELKVGDCTKELSEGESSSVDAVPCDEPHDSEVYAIVPVARPDLPSEAEMTTIADQGCTEQLATAAPAAIDDDAVEIFYLYPTKTSWALGDRDIVCFVQFTTGPRTGSIRTG